MKKIKILEMCGFSSGICGVFSRVKEESLRLAKKGYDVRIFSSDFVKGSNQRASQSDSLNSIQIRRFPAIKLGGESFMHWKGGKSKVLKSVGEFKPDLIIAHSYRHTHTVIASKIAKKLHIPSILVTHAPFDAVASPRTFLSKYFIKLYHDPFIAKPSLKRFDKILVITQWEIPYLNALGVAKEKITYVPNGIPEEFFTQKKAKEENKILFLGRIAPVKNLEVMIEAMTLIKDKEVLLEIVGPAEQDYLDKLKQLIKNLGIENRVRFSPAVYNIKEKIAKIDSAKIFILPSKREGMPQSLIEAMARQKIVISSDNPGALDLIRDGKNGFIFQGGNAQALAGKISTALSSPHSNLRKNAQASVKKFSWNEIIKALDKLIKEEIRNNA